MEPEAKIDWTGCDVIEQVPGKVGGRRNQGNPHWAWGGAGRRRTRSNARADTREFPDAPGRYDTSHSRLARKHQL